MQHCPIAQQEGNDARIASAVGIKPKFYGGLDNTFVQVRSDSLASIQDARNRGIAESCGAGYILNSHF